jgi:hypothetical protein
LFVLVSRQFLETWVVVAAVGSILVRWRRDGLLAPEEVGEGGKQEGDETGRLAASDQTLLLGSIPTARPKRYKPYSRSVHNSRVARRIQRLMDLGGRSFPHIDILGDLSILGLGLAGWRLPFFSFSPDSAGTNEQQSLHPYSTLILQSRVSLMKQTPSQDPVRHSYFEEITSVHLSSVVRSASRLLPRELASKSRLKIVQNSGTVVVVWAPVHSENASWLHVYLDPSRSRIGMIVCARSSPADDVFPCRVEATPEDYIPDYCRRARGKHHHGGILRS